MRRGWQRITRLVSAALRDLFADAEGERSHPSLSLDDPLAEKLAGLQARLDELTRQADAAEAGARELLVGAALGEDPASGAAEWRPGTPPWHRQAAALAAKYQAAQKEADALRSEVQ